MCYPTTSQEWHAS